MHTVNGQNKVLAHSRMSDYEEVHCSSRAVLLVGTKVFYHHQTHYMPTHKGIDLHIDRIKKVEGLSIERVCKETIVDRLNRAQASTSSEPFGLIWISGEPEHAIPLYCHKSKRDGKLYVLELDSIGHQYQFEELDMVRSELASNESITYLFNTSIRQAARFGCHIDAFETLIFTYRTTKTVEHILDEITINPEDQNSFQVPIHWIPAVQIMPKNMEARHLVKRVDDAGRTILEVISNSTRTIRFAEASGEVVPQRKIRCYLNDHEYTYHLFLRKKVSEVVASSMAFNLVDTAVDRFLRTKGGYVERRVFDFLRSKGFSETSLTQSYKSCRESGQDWVLKMLKLRRVKRVMGEFILSELFYCKDPASSPFLKYFAQIKKIELPLRGMNYNRDFKVINEKLRGVLPYLSNLESINLVGADQTFLNELAINCPLIRYLSLDSSSAERIPSEFTMLKEFNVRDSCELQAIEPKTIQKFIIQNCNRLLSFTPASGATGRIEIYTAQLSDQFGKPDGVSVEDMTAVDDLEIELDD